MASRDLRRPRQPRYLSSRPPTISSWSHACDRRIGSASWIPRLGSHRLRLRPASARRRPAQLPRRRRSAAVQSSGRSSSSSCSGSPPTSPRTPIDRSAKEAADHPTTPAAQKAMADRHRTSLLVFTGRSSSSLSRMCCAGRWGELQQLVCNRRRRAPCLAGSHRQWQNLAAFMSVTFSSAHRVWELLREAHLAAPFRVDTVPCQKKCPPEPEQKQEVVNRKIPTWIMASNVHFILERRA
jgi:hypothetical protein